MQYEKQLTVEREDERVVYVYYVRKNSASEFECEMYNVGISSNAEKGEIEDFSPSFNEAVALCDYLYKENVTPANIFLMGEEFLEQNGI